MKVSLRLHSCVAVLAVIASAAGLRSQDVFDEDDVDPREHLEQVVKSALGTRNPKKPDVLGSALVPGAPRHDRRVAQILRRGRYNLTFEKARLTDALDTFRELSGLTFIVSAKARKALKAKDPVIDLRMKNLSLDSYLNLIATRLGDYRFLIRHGAVHLVRVSEYRQKTYLRVYYVGDLVRRRPHFRAPKLGLGTRG